MNIILTASPATVAPGDTITLSWTSNAYAIFGPTCAFTPVGVDVPESSSPAAAGTDGPVTGSYLPNDSVSVTAPDIGGVAVYVVVGIGGAPPLFGNTPNVIGTVTVIVA